MVYIQIERCAYTSKCIYGKLYVLKNGEVVYDCQTLEPPVRKNFGCIDLGDYKAVLYHSPKFKRDVILLKDVPYRSLIEIHSGNTVNDTRGCILVGVRFCGSSVLHNSRVTLNSILSYIDKDEDITVSVCDELPF